MTGPYLHLLESGPPQAAKPKPDPYARLYLPPHTADTDPDNPPVDPFVAVRGQSKQPSDITAAGHRRKNPGEYHIGGVPGEALKMAQGMAESPVTTAAMMNPVGATIAVVGMGKDIAQYAGQKVAERSFDAPTRAKLENDPERIPGARAALEAGLLALPGVAKVAKHVNETAEAALHPLETPLRADWQDKTARNLLDQLHPPKPTALDVATAGPPERFSGLGVPSDVAKKIRTAYRSAVVTPHAEIEEQAPELASALTKLGASRGRAQHITERRLDRVFAGLNDTQQRDFQNRLLLDQFEGEAQRKAATAPDVAARFQAHADQLRPKIPPGLESEPWFQQAIKRYKSDIETPLTDAAIRAGVDPANLRPTKLAYTKLASEARLNDAEIRKAMEVAGVSDPADLQPRNPMLRRLIGEKPELARYFANHTQGPRQGPLAKNAGGPPVGLGSTGPRTQTTGSARMAEGTAESYSPDLRRVLAVDTPEKLRKAANNDVIKAVEAIGRKLGPKELPEPGKRVLSFDQKHLVLLPEDAEPITSVTANRYEVTPEVHAAVSNAFRTPERPSGAGKMLRSVSDVATRAQISGVPVEATSHANTLASIVSKVPGEKDIAGKVLAAIPGQGAKMAAVREMATMDMNHPDIVALGNRLADIGALRVQEEHGGLINSASRWLFGQKGGVDLRGRLVLARKFLERSPNATDEQLRQFIVTKLGNYVPENATNLTNFAAKGSVLSPFARFQTARIPTAIKNTLGQSDLPSSSGVQRVGDVANTLYRGPIGHVAGAAILTKVLSGKNQSDNEPGHALDINTGLSARPGGISRSTGAEGEKPLYIPAATLDPVTYAGMRATGLRAFLASPNTPESSKGAEALRDVVNVGMGTAGPFVRGAMTATTGTQPYLQSDNTFLRVIPHEFTANQELRDKVTTALGLANPAVKAFSDAGGDAAPSLAKAMSQDGKFMGGPASLAARVSEFLMPRIVSPSIGGRTNEQSVMSQEDRRYTEAMADYTKQLRAAAGPVARARIIDRARQSAQSAGFDADRVVTTLEKAQEQDQEARHEKANRGLLKRAEQRRTSPP